MQLRLAHFISRLRACGTLPGMKSHTWGHTTSGLNVMVGKETSILDTLWSATLSALVCIELSLYGNLGNCDRLV